MKKKKCFFEINPKHDKTTQQTTKFKVKKFLYTPKMTEKEKIYAGFAIPVL